MIYSKILLGLFSIVLFGIACKSEGDKDIEMVREFLTNAYPMKSDPLSDYMIYPDSSIWTIDTPSLTRAFGIKMYRSVLLTGNPEYPDLSIAIALKPDKTMKVCKSPTYQDPDEAFLALIRGTCVDENEKIELALDFGNVMSSITYKGAIDNIKQSKTGISIQLYHGEMYWRRIDLDFEANCLTGIRVSNPHSSSD